jgi:hypothetical protein
MKLTCSQTKLQTIIMNVPPPWAMEVIKDLNKVKSISVLVDSSSYIDLK